MNVHSAVDDELIRQSAEMLEIAVLDLVLKDAADDEEKQRELKLAAADAFRRPASCLTRPERRFRLVRFSGIVQETEKRFCVFQEKCLWTTKFPFF